MTEDRDTRDRVIRCEEKLDRALPMLEVLYTAHLQATGKWSLAATAVGVLKHVPAGALGAGILAAVQHLKVPALALAILLLPASARAFGAPADEENPVVLWSLQARYCDERACLTLERVVGGAGACEVAGTDLRLRFPGAETSCVETRAPKRPA